MNDSALLPVIISSLISLLIGIFTFWNTRMQLKHNQRKIFEDIDVELIKQRIEPYTAFMTELKIISSVELAKETEEIVKQKIIKLVEIIQANIFGKIGLLASHETREIILRLRAKCLAFLQNGQTINEVHKAAMEVHQILRSDMGLAQPGLLNNIQKLRKKEIAGKEEQIEKLIKRIYHNKWKFNGKNSS